MPKTIYRPEHAALLHLLKTYRKAAGLTQVECSKALDRPQSFMSDVENGTRRLDIVQLRDLCVVLRTSLPALVQELETAINAGDHNQQTTQNDHLPSRPKPEPLSKKP